MSVLTPLHTIHKSIAHIFQPDILLTTVSCFDWSAGDESAADARTCEKKNDLIRITYF